MKNDVSRQCETLLRQLEQGQTAQAFNAAFEWVKTGVINRREFLIFMDAVSAQSAENPFAN